MRAYAKINLSLDVLGKREDGYHNIQSVMQQIDLSDELELKEHDDIVVQSQYKDDIILRAVLKLQELYGVKKGVMVTVKKNIPVGAGFGSASTNAAVALKALNELWGLGLSEGKLMEIGAGLGADVPFCIKGGCCFVSGIGEKVEEINGFEMHVVLVGLGYSIATKEAYDELDKKDYGMKESSLRLKDADSVKGIASCLNNDFINIQKDDVKGIISDVISCGALNASITGKGPAVFGIFESEEKAVDAYNKLKDKYDWVYRTKTIS